MLSNPFNKKQVQETGSPDSQWVMQRREFLKLTVVLASSMPSVALANTTEPVKLDPPWGTLDSLSMHLLPESEFGVSARQINALAYMQKRVGRPDYESWDFLKKGVGWLEDFSKQKHNNTFAQLSKEQKEALLRQIAKSRAGENWLTMVLNNLLEAMLTDPIYGGNPNGIGWKTVGHQPGYPRPNSGQTYFQTGYYKRKNTRRNFKGGV